MAPFPYLPMGAILVSLVSFLVIQMGIFAYAGFMVEYLGIVSQKDKAGYYAGCLSSAFMAGRMFSSHFWGLVSDRYGCRLVLVVGIVSSAVLAIAFGFSTSFTWAVVCRFLFGLFNGMMAASKTLVPILCGEEHKTVGMGVVSMAWSIGAVLGSGLGGMLAEPATHYPLTFSERGIFGRNPYLLPNVVGAGLALLSLPLVLIFVKESRHTGNRSPTDEEQPGRPAQALLVRAITATVAEIHQCVPEQAANSSTVKKKPPAAQTEKTPMIAKQNGPGTAVVIQLGYDAVDLNPRSLLAQPHIRALLFIDGLYSFAYTGFDEVFALWSLSTAAKGGLDWSSSQIGQMFLSAGLMMIMFDALAVPNLTPRMGIAAYQRVAAALQVPAYVMIPMLSTASLDGLPVAILSIVLLFTCYACTNSFYLGIAVAINNATGPERRGELNGYSAAVTSFTRTLSPVFFSTMFAFSIDGSHSFPFDYHLVFYVIALMSSAAACMGWNRIK